MAKAIRRLWNSKLNSVEFEQTVHAGSVLQVPAKKTKLSFKAST